MEPADTHPTMDERQAVDANSANGDGRSNLLAGILFSAIAAAALIISRDYEAGSAVSMGPGYFPRLIAIGLLGLGLLLTIKGVRAGAQGSVGTGLQPTVYILGAILLFAFLIEHLGLFATCLLAVMFAALAQSQINWTRTVVIAVALATGCSFVFGYALNLSLSIWPS